MQLLASLMWRRLVILFVFCRVSFSPNNWKVNPYFRLNSEPGHLHHISVRLYNISLLFRVVGGYFPLLYKGLLLCFRGATLIPSSCLTNISEDCIPPPARCAAATLAPCAAAEGGSPDVTFHESREQMSKIETEGNKDRARKRERQGWREMRGHVGNLRNENIKAWRQKLGTQMRKMQVLTWPQWKSNNPGFQGHKTSKRKWWEQRCGTKSLIFSCKCLSAVVFFLNWFVQQEGMRDGEWKGRCSSENYRWKKKKSCNWLLLVKP